MKSSGTNRNLIRVVILSVALSAFAALPLLSNARTANTNQVTIVNNSNRVIRYVYLSHVGADDWSGDQLGGSSISSGQSATVSFSCDSQQMKVIGEDQDGCFLSEVVACGGNSTWTITNATAADCGQ
jgi:hypothetical protein